LQELVDRELTLERQLRNNEPSDEILEDLVPLTEMQIEQYFPLWLRWRSTGKRHLLSQLMKEPELPYMVVDELETIYQRMLTIKREENG
jgi:hypothetical protein